MADVGAAVIAFAAFAAVIVSSGWVPGWPARASLGRCVYWIEDPHAAALWNIGGMYTDISCAPTIDVTSFAAGELTFVAGGTPTVDLQSANVPGGLAAAIVAFALVLALAHARAIVRSGPGRLAAQSADHASGAALLGATMDCPRCAETVKAAALVCRFCGHEFQSRAA